MSSLNEIKYILRNCNCYEQIKKLKSNSVDLIVTDPPYKLKDGAGKFRNKRAYGKDIKNMINGFDYSILDEMLRVMKKINIYMFCSHDQIIDLIDFFVKEHQCKWDIITWHKTNPIPVCNNTYLHDTEYCLFFREQSTKVFGNYKTKHTYYLSPINIKEKRKYSHPTIKPLNLIDDFIINSSKENQTVLDTFMGSGTTGVACKHLNRKFIGYEINRCYFETAKKRIFYAQ